MAQPPHDPLLEGQISDFVRRIHRDHRGDMWFGTHGDGVIRYDGGSLQRFSLSEGFGGAAVRGIVEGPRPWRRKRLLHVVTGQRVVGMVDGHPAAPRTEK